MDHKTAIILEYAKMIVSEKLSGGTDYIALRDGEDCLYTNAPLESLTERDVVRVKCSDNPSSVTAIFNTYENVNAIIYAHPKYCSVAAKANRDMYAPLDDMAQIVGYKCRTSPNRTDKIIASLKGANSIFIENEGALTTGRTLDEAFTCLRVLEKAAFINIYGNAIGGAKKIGFLDAKLMRFIYKMKYSKQNQKNKAEGEA